ncbi:MAG TPA: hypothetical protein VH540_23120 [Ktedonobacterales bacterium]|jgi:hypothetical protein
MLAVEVVLFGLALWLGLYLIRREPRSSRLRLAALSLLAYALGLGCELLRGVNPTLLLARLTWVVFVLPLLLVLALAWRTRPRTLPRVLRFVSPALVLLLIVSTGLTLADPAWFPRFRGAALLGVGLIALGILLVRLEARDQGEVLTPDLLSSLDFALCAGLVFAGPVALVMLLATGPTLPLVLLLLVTLTLAIATQVFSSQIAAFSDRLALAAFPQLRRARADLRATADALPRLNQALDLQKLDEAEFIRLTRRAFSFYSDLAWLTASPLTTMPLIEERLAARGAKMDALERAIELKALLTECIERLKPPQKGDFGTSPEWRYYNALYFPYVVGLRPYSLRSQQAPADPTDQAALLWFRTQVPERTLHHWQNAATILIAQELRRSI